MSYWVYYSDRIIIYFHYCKFVDECRVVLHNAVFYRIRKYTLLN